MNPLQEDIEFLEHFGTKGMKWGVRRQRRAQALTRAGTKGGPVVSKVRAAGRLGPVDFVKGRGLTGGARRKAVRVTSRNERIENGKASVLDRLKYHGSLRVTDLVPVRRSRAGRESTVRSDYAMVAGAGALVVAQILAGRAIRARAG